MATVPSLDPQSRTFQKKLLQSAGWTELVWIFSMSTSGQKFERLGLLRMPVLWPCYNHVPYALVTSDDPRADPDLSEGIKWMRSVWPALDIEPYLFWWKDLERMQPEFTLYHWPAHPAIDWVCPTCALVLPEPMTNNELPCAGALPTCGYSLITTRA